MSDRKKLKPEVTTAPDGSKFLARIDALAPWKGVLQDHMGHRGYGVWEQGDRLWRVTDDVPPRLLLLSPQGEIIERWTCSEALVQLHCEGDEQRALRDLLLTASGEWSALNVVLPSDVIGALRELVQPPAQSSVGTTGAVSSVPTDHREPSGVGGSGAVVGRASGCLSLDNVRDFLLRYVILPKAGDYDVLTAWIAHTYLIDGFDTTPRLAFLSPQSSSGKTRAVELLALLVSHPVSSIDSTIAALFRGIEAADGKATLLLDEVDTIFQGANPSAEGIRGILNSGYKRGATVQRAGAQRKGFPVESFRVFAPVALAGLGTLPSTLMTRSVQMNMRRRHPDEPLQRYRKRDVEPEAKVLKQDLEHWCAQHAAELCVPDLPAELQDRAAEVWEPLIAVADLAGGQWSESLRVAAVAAVAGSSDTDTFDNKLLGGIRTVFAQGGVTQMPTKDLIKGLSKLDSISVQDLTPEKLSSTLKPYGIRSKSVRQGKEVKRGYDEHAFKDAWARYLPANAATPATPATEPSDDAEPED